jgi:four helix bundle protein
MTEKTNLKRYDLEERTFEYARKTINFTKTLPKNISNIELIKQLVRSCSSVGANYIEANDSLSRKDFIMRIKICKKESKESLYWMKLIEVNGKEAEQHRQLLMNENVELMKIFAAILEKTK